MKQKMKMDTKKKKISSVIAVRLFIAVFTTFAVSSVVIYVLLNRQCDNQAKSLLKYNSVCTALDLRKSTVTTAYEWTKYQLEAYESGDEEAISEYVAGTSYTYYAEKDGTIFISGNENFIGKNIRDIEYVSTLLDFYYGKYGDSNTEEVFSEMTPKPVKTLDGKMDLYYIVMIDGMYPDVVALSAYSTDYYEKWVELASENVMTNRNVGETGICVAIDQDNTIIAINNFSDVDTKFPNSDLIEKYELGTGGDFDSEPSEVDFYGEKIEFEYKLMFGKDSFWEEDCYYCLNKANGIYILSLYPVSEAMSQVYTTIIYILIIEVMVFAVLFIVLHLLIKGKVIRKLDSVNASLAKITGGNLEEKVDVRDTTEFDSLSTDINLTVDRLKEYIAEAAARIDADLAVAKSIQGSALPSVFPPFPERREFELYASMNAAKEVGGDFYDFYMLNDCTLGFLIADVSGKSIPGAMFMMTSKTVIKSLAESGLPPAEVFTLANEKLCEGNEAEMFVTAWLGYLDLATGIVHVANAGHNPPVLIHEGKAEYVILKPGLMLAGMDCVRYKEQTLQLYKGDMLYLYTDGVTEAMDVNEEQYGEDRLLKLLSFGENYPESSDKKGITEAVCEMVIRDVKQFTEGAEQSDDITMLCLRYIGR
ncbi:MAG: SpoIIE family protein phosphatase [Lachnospiraceae bacterium]|nr:SpoIIE family protein phosphatase [Lachnospiraceae bacterium]